MVPPGCVLSYYMLDAQLFLQPQFVGHDKNTVLYYVYAILNCFLGPSACVRRYLVVSIH